MNSISGNVYLAPLGASPPVKMEISGDDWKIVGYVKNVEMTKEVDFEEVTSDYGYDNWIFPKFEKHTITAEFTNDIDGKTWQLLTGFDGDNYSVSEEKPVDAVKRLLHG